MAPIMLVEQAMTVEKAGTVASMPASISTSRAMLLKVRLGTTTPHTAKSGLPPLSSATMWRATGTESSMASKAASGPSTLAKGVRTPAASQMSAGRGIAGSPSTLLSMTRPIEALRTRARRDLDITHRERLLPSDRRS